MTSGGQGGWEAGENLTRGTARAIKGAVARGQDSRFGGGGNLGRLIALSRPRRPLAPRATSYSADGRKRCRTRHGQGSAHARAV